MKQRLFRNRPGSDAATSRDFLSERLQRVFTHANQLHWTAEWMPLWNAYHNNNVFYIAPQQQLYELLALYKSTNIIEHINMLLKLAYNNNSRNKFTLLRTHWPRWRGVRKVFSFFNCVFIRCRINKSSVTPAKVTSMNVLNPLLSMFRARNSDFARTLNQWRQNEPVTAQTSEPVKRGHRNPSALWQFCFCGSAFSTCVPGLLHTYNYVFNSKNRHLSEWLFSDSIHKILYRLFFKYSVTIVGNGFLGNKQEKENSMC